jgi:hypothetical protein
MLQNPNLAPSASINCWISTILSFYFTLVYVPSKQHCVNSHSCCLQQPKNFTVSENNYNKELGCCFLTMHFCLHLVSCPCSTAIDFVKATLITGPPLDYFPCPQTKKTTDANNTLALIAHFSETLEPLSGPSEKALQAFVHLTTKCFVDLGKLWKHNNANAHRLMLTPVLRIPLDDNKTLAKF